MHCRPSLHHGELHTLVVGWLVLIGCAALRRRCYWATMRRKLGLLAADEGAADRALIEDLLQARLQTGSGWPWSVGWHVCCLAMQSKHSTQESGDHAYLRSFFGTITLQWPQVLPWGPLRGRASR